MRNIFKNISFIIAIIAVLHLSSCTESNTGFLDPDLSGELNETMVFSDSIYTLEFHTKLYRELGYTYFLDNSLYGGGYWGYQDIADGARCLWTGTAQMAHMWNMNTWTATSARIRNHWNIPYQSIVRANMFLGKVDNSPLSEAKIRELKAEARFLRAWYYYHLLRSFGGTPMIGDKVFGISDKIEEPRATFEEQVDYIVSECDAVASILPAQRVGNNYGRITSGAAMALKTKVLLFAASPLSNGAVPVDNPSMKPFFGYDNYDVNRWKKAADAAKAVIDLNRYILIEDNETAPGYGFYQMQNLRVNDEYIFSLMKQNNKFSENLLLPASRGGQCYSSPYQSVADAFLMKNGKQITDPSSGYVDLKMYENREPRFYYSLLYDGAMWIPRTGSAVPTRINLYDMAPTDGVGRSSGATKTGYLWRKFCNENVTGSSGVGNNDNIYPFIRYADILLAYAEALNEYDSNGSKNTIEEIMFRIRKRAGIEPGADNRYGIPAAYTQESMRELIHLERRLEFACEESHRYQDLRRWGKLIAAKKDVEFYGIRWSDPNEGPQTYELFVLDKHLFSERQNYFPIPQTEIDIIGKDLLPQNPGW